MKNYLATIDNEIKMAIQKHQGETLSPGTACAHPSDPTIYTLVEYDGDEAVLSYNGIIKRFPAKEIFDINIVKDTALKLHHKIH